MRESQQEVSSHGPREMPDGFQPASAPTSGDPLRQTEQGAAPMPDPLVNFEGQSDAENQAAAGGRVVPPDTNGDVGPNHYVQWINLVLSVYDKTDGSRVLGPIPGNAIFDGFGGACETENDGDPTVVYDQFANRWVLSQFVFQTSQCVAVSQTDDPTGAYFLYEFPTPGSDYPKMGVWGDAYYMTYRNFSGSGDFIQAVALEKEKMLVGDPTATIVRRGIPDMPPDFWEGVLPPHTEGLIPSPVGAPAPYVMAYDDEFFSDSPNPAGDSYKVWHFDVDFANPGSSAITGPISLPTEEFDANLCGGSRNCIDQPAPATVGLDALSGFTMWRAVYHGATNSLWVNHTVDADGADTAGVRWAEIHDPAGTPTLNQAGTYAPDDGESRWVGSLAVDASGNMALGYSVSSSEVFPSIRYAGRLASDPPGTLGQAETELWAGTGSQTGTCVTGAFGGCRWGDYSSMSLDESDGCTFWYTNEYYQTSGGFDFHTRIGSFQFLTCVADEIGTLQGTVTDASGDPLSGATVAAEGTSTFSTTTDEDGHYTMTVIADTYDVTASKFGFVSETATGVVVTDGATTTRDFALDPAPTATVSGTVTDGSGHGWPLYARIGVDGAPIPDIFTDPATGAYSLDVPEGSTITLTVNAVSQGYNTQARTVVATPGGQDEDFALVVGQACNAPGYVFGGTALPVEDFNDGVLPAGWTIVDNAGTGEVWQFTNPGNRPNNTGGDGRFAIVDSDRYGSGTAHLQDTSLVTPLIDLSDVAEPVIQFNQDFNWFSGGLDEKSDVDVSIDGGATWTNVLHQEDADVTGPRQTRIPIPMAAGEPDAQVRFHYGPARFEFWWQIDNVAVGACTPIDGGLLVGNVSDANTGAGLSGADVTSDNDPSITTTTVNTPDDPNVDDGFYMLFSPLTGAQPFTATNGQYGPVTQTPNVVADNVAVQDFSLPSGLIEADPASVGMEVRLGNTATTTLTLNNVGGIDAEFEIVDAEATEAAPAPVPASVGDVGEAERINAIDLASALGEPVSSLQVINPSDAEVDCDTEPGLVIHDDGTVENGYSGNVAGGVTQVRFVDKFTPSAYPATYSAVCVALLTQAGGPSSLNVDLVAFDDDGAGGTPGTQLGSMPVTVTGIPTSLTPVWASFDISSLGLTVGEGSVFIGVRYAPPTPVNVFTASDESTTHPVGFAGGFWWNNNANAWAPIQTAFPSYRSLMVRAVEGSADVPWLSAEPTTGTVPAGGSTNVTLTFEATATNGITHPGEYPAVLRVTSNTPSATTTIPVTLTVPPNGFGTFKGSVLGEAGSVPDATVEAMQNGEVIETATTDVLGKYTLVLPPGTYDLHAFKGDLEAVATNVTVKADKTTNTNLTITQGVGTFMGKVNGGQGGPVPGATVVALQNGQVIASTTTDAKGNYTLKVSPGTYDLRATLGTRQVNQPGVTVVANQIVTVNLKLPAGGLLL